MMMTMMMMTMGHCIPACSSLNIQKYNYHEDCDDDHDDNDDDDDNQDYDDYIQES